MLSPSLEDVDATEREHDIEPARPPRAAGRVGRRAAAIVGLLIVFFGVLIVRNWRADSNDGATKVASPASAGAFPTSSAIEEKYGVRFIGVDVTSGGGMIQVRYQILDSAKTEAIHDQTASPYVVDARGHKFADPGMAGHSHIGPVKPSGTTDFVLLANAGGGVKPGSFVTIKIGDLELKHVPVV